MKITLIQMNSGADKAANLAAAEALIEDAVARERPDMIALPETFALMTGDSVGKRAEAETIPDGPACRMLSALARKHGVWIHGGSLHEAAGGKCHNTTTVWDRAGKLCAQYRKLHLFDVDVPGGASYRESDTILAGDSVVCFEAEAITFGCAICYDLRFPELFRALRDRGAQAIFLPSAFTLMTGRDHWEPLLRARAIETQCYMIAPAQIFAHDGGRRVCYGRSMVVDPWGVVQATASDRVGHVSACIDPDYVHEVRAALPVGGHHVLG
ncbi:carbon-nitrogen hydrolase family protein [Alkalilacustris brevis]|uniref:carbon-nitrogen hydrolase family protein n=1 Tax=Alkalilacustris brevis TaxID=2026338 RepID=UPI000E0CDA93|nr:carbon-nitrogen hydrolase family protein [Alkalilacustris brevis]